MIECNLQTHTSLYSSPACSSNTIPEPRGYVIADVPQKSALRKNRNFGKINSEMFIGIAEHDLIQ